MRVGIGILRCNLQGIEATIGLFEEHQFLLGNLALFVQALKFRSPRFAVHDTAFDILEKCECPTVKERVVGWIGCPIGKFGLVILQDTL
jgi:hypothetical protein